MAFTDEEIKESYLDDITKWCPKNGRVNSVIKRGNISDELIVHIRQKQNKDRNDGK